jgi:hypothetical protein
VVLLVVGKIRSEKKIENFELDSGNSELRMMKNVDWNLTFYTRVQRLGVMAMPGRWWLSRIPEKFQRIYFWFPQTCLKLPAVEIFFVEKVFLLR